jgi:hypothetical protein
MHGIQPACVHGQPPRSTRRADHSWSSLALRYNVAFTCGSTIHINLFLHSQSDEPLHTGPCSHAPCRHTFTLPLLSLICSKRFSCRRMRKLEHLVLQGSCSVLLHLIAYLNLPALHTLLLQGSAVGRSPAHQHPKSALHLRCASSRWRLRRLAHWS